MNKQLRDYQQVACDKVVECLKVEDTCLLVAPTGAGKTVMMASICKALDFKRVLVLQHRAELLNQNTAEFKNIIGGHVYYSEISANKKTYYGNIIFGMVQTLCRPKNLKLLNQVDLIIVDEAHHIKSNSYSKILNHFPESKILGVTATPERSDKKGLDTVFKNIVDEITTSFLIESGYLVKPRCFAISKMDLKKVNKIAGEYNMRQVEKQLNVTLVNDSIFDNWNKLAGNRKTVVFASTIDHAKAVYEVFKSKGIKCAILDKNLSSQDRANILNDLKHNRIQVIFNVFILTEGFDDPSIDCVVLLRPCSHKSTMVQMIGRCLRLFLGKIDAIVLDFGESVKTHGLIDVEFSLSKNKGTGEAPFKICDNCGAVNATRATHCVECNEEFIKEKVEIDDYEMREITKESDTCNIEFDWIQMAKDCVALVGRSDSVGNGNYYQDSFVISKGNEIHWKFFDNAVDASFKTTDKKNIYYSDKHQLYYDSAESKIGSDFFLHYVFQSRQGKLYGYSIIKFKKLVEKMILKNMKAKVIKSKFDKHSYWRKMRASDKQVQYYDKIRSYKKLKNKQFKKLNNMNIGTATTAIRASKILSELTH